MTRQEAHDKCTEKIAQEPLLSFKVAGNGLLRRVDEGGCAWFTRTFLPPEAVDAIIDCAVEEAVLALKGEQK